MLPSGWKITRTCARMCVREENRKAHMVFFPPFKSSERGGRVPFGNISQPLLSVECYKRVLLCRSSTLDVHVHFFLWWVIQHKQASGLCLSL